MNYLPDLRASIVDAAHRQHAATEAADRERNVRTTRWRQSLHGGRAILASVMLSFAGTAVGAVQVGAPLGPEPKVSRTIVEHAPASAAPRP